MNEDNNKTFLENIINEKIGESDRLEFKNYHFPNGRLNDLKQKQVSSLMKEICAFANSYGGQIIIGIEEDKDHNPAKLSDTGVDESTFEIWEQSLRNKIATNTIPVIYGLNISLVKIDNNTNCIVIDVPTSVLKPHAINNGSKDEFYIRNGNITSPMRYNDLKNSFNELEFKQEKITRFINNRLSFILDGNPDETFATDSSLVIHIIPEWSLDNSNFLDLKKLQYVDNFGVICPPNAFAHPLFNTDGLLKYYGEDARRKIMSYIQIFTNGRIEATEVRLLNDIKKGVIHRWNEIEEVLVNQIYKYFIALEEAKVLGAYYFTITLLNVKGKKVKDKYGNISEPLTHNIIKTPIVKWSPKDSYPKTIYPILTSLAYACGLSQSYYYDKDNKPIEEKFKFLKQIEK